MEEGERERRKEGGREGGKVEKRKKWHKTEEVNDNIFFG
jgi:hypothetical protein